MEKNKTRKYLKYAIGEIILVVIGILIALSINNWNEVRKEHLVELEALKDLKSEFERNILVFEEHLNEKRIGKNKIDTYINLLIAGNANVEDIIAFYDYGFSGYTYNPSNGVLSSVINSGNINTLSRKELKYELTSWNDVLFDYQEEEIIALNFGFNHIDNFDNKLKPKFNTRFNDTSDKEYDQMYINLSKTLTHRNQMIEMQGFLGVIIDEGKGLLTKMKHINQLITLEIESHK
ncbi:MAG: DUF6090 family protein [Cyclobacteriaceae bacterium]